MDLKIRPIKNNVFYIGSKDANRQLFDQLVPLPQEPLTTHILLKAAKKQRLLTQTILKSLMNTKKDCKKTILLM